MGEDGDWLLRQRIIPSDCGRFGLQHLGGNNVARVSCYGMYVTAPLSGTTDLDWALRQETGLTRPLSHRHCTRVSLGSANGSWGLSVGRPNRVVEHLSWVRVYPWGVGR